MEKQNVHECIHLDGYILDATPKRIVERYHSLPAYAQEHRFGVLDEDVVVVDTETTGFSFNHDELIQIAAARMVNGEIVGWYITFVNPGKEIPEEVAHLTNIHDEEVADAPDAETAVAGLVEFVGNSDLVAHNAHFDRTFITKYAAGECLKENRWIDSLDLARIALPRFTSHRLLDLVRAFGGPDSTHRADDDVAATCLVYRILLAGVANMPVELLEYVAATREVSEWNSVYVFKTILAWLKQQNTSSETEFETFRLRSMRYSALSGTNSAAEPALAKSADAPRVFATADEVTEAFSPDGLVGRLYDNYEVRVEQQQMARAVNHALSTSSNLAVEAGTGVGKSMAYLVPLALMAKRSGITAGVATKTNALLDQLMHRELPLLADALDIRYAALKGFSHYPCLRKVDHLAYKGPEVINYRNQEIDQAPGLAALLSFIEQTDYDDIDALKIDYRAIPRWRITTNSAECLRRKCPFFGKTCFVHGAREAAQNCDIVVTNHSLLFWDVRFEGGLLPPIRHWVVDEAHGAEAEARRSLSVSVSSTEVQSLVRRVSSDDPARNVFLKAMGSSKATDQGRTLYEALISKALNQSGAFAAAAEEYWLAAKDLLAFDDRPKSRGYEYFDLWLSDEIRANATFKGVASCAVAVHDSLEKLIAAARDVVSYAEQIDDTSAAQRDVALATLEMQELYNALEQVFSLRESNKVASVRLNRTKAKLDEVFTVQPLDVGADLDEAFYQQTDSVIYTSATLSVDGHFDTFLTAMGVASGDEEASAIQIESSYDFDTNMKVFVPTDMPDPQDPQYLPALQKLLTDLHLAQDGSMLTLFTNRREMENCFDAVQPVLKEHDLRLVCQKWGVSVKGLRDDFLKDEHLSLFALKSFWEGFDAPGATLKGVVIPKLPFGLPTDPLSCERQARDDRAWAHYSLPAAVIDVKQAVGRLIRSSTDRGIVVLADARLVHKYYGAKFLNSLPSSSVQMLPCEQIVEEVARFNDCYAPLGNADVLRETLSGLDG